MVKQEEDLREELMAEEGIDERECPPPCPPPPAIQHVGDGVAGLGYGWN